MTAPAGEILLDVPYADVRAADLRLSTGGEVPPTLADVTVEPLPGAPSAGAGAVPPLTLGILGASHVAFVGDRGAPVYVEELSCTAVDGVPLAAVGPDDPAEADAGRGGASRAIRVETADAAVFAEVVDLVRSLADDPAAVVAEFPGAPGALTALRGIARPGGYDWRTWHLYPGPAGGGEVVHSWTRWRGESLADGEVTRR